MRRLDLDLLLHHESLLEMLGQTERRRRNVEALWRVLGGRIATIPDPASPRPARGAQASASDSVSVSVSASASASVPSTPVNAMPHESAPPTAAMRPEEMTLRKPASGPPLSHDAPGDVVLVVDDEAAVRAALVRLLRSAGFGPEAVLEAPSAEAAMKVLATSPVTAIISDYRMPGGTGVELLTRARARDHHAVRILLTAYGDKEMAIEAINRGRVDAFLHKPWDNDALLAKVHDLLARRRADVASEVAKAREVTRLAAAHTAQRGVGAGSSGHGP